jgi:DNA-binding CsgD family transcriptional regulator
LDWHTGAWDGLAQKTSALATSEDLQTGAHAILVTGLLAAATSDTQAEASLQRAMEETRKCGATEYCIESAAALARLQLAAGRTGDALRVTDEPFGIVARKGVWVWAADLAPARVAALAAAGKAGEAADLIAAYARGLRGRNAPAPKAALVLCRALLAEAHSEHGRAAALFARAAAAWQALPRPYDALLAREQEARCLLPAGKTKTGLALLSEVRQDLVALGAVRDADRLASTLRAHGVTVPRVWRGGRRGYGNELSPREVEVLRLVVAGCKDREIARVLHRSPDTVYAQLKSARRKLGVSSRATLALRAVEAGVVAGSQPVGDVGSPAGS